ncbi:recombinase family protein [Collinsella sp. HCP28S3_F2]|uniref:recombinase family protein n=1 Tax=unclassified Collinsella TaxID=2637548 RepID=UPI003F8CC72E
MTRDTTRAAIYLRISRDSTKRGEAIERQREDCETTCAVKGWEIVEEYVDLSISAYSGKARPNYERMISDYKAGRFDVIVAWKLDRLTRSTKGFADMLDELREQKLRICTSDLGDVDLSKSDARFTTNILVNVAQFESDRKSERSKRANLQRAKHGYIKPGTRAFGYDGHFHVIEKEAEVVRAIYAQYLKGSSMNAISRAIAGETGPNLPKMPLSDAPSVIFAREKGKPLPDCTWSLANTQTILRNPKYAGYVAYVPTINGKCQSPGKNWTEYIVRDENGNPVKAAWEAIVDTDTWWAVQRKRDKNRYRKDGSPIDRAGNVRKHFGAGVYRCGICGGPMHSGDSSYRCDGHVNRMRSKVDEYVLAVIRARLAREDLRDLLAKGENPRLGEISAELSKARGEIERARHDYKARLIDGPLFKEIKDEQDAIISRLEAERLSLLPDNPATGIIEAEDPVAAFDAITDPGQIAEVINFFCTVTLMPHEQGKRTTPETLKKDVIIKWK